MTKTEAVKRFLTLFAFPDLGSRYNYDMELQVNVAQDDGQPTAGEFNGRAWKAWTDGVQIWKPFRVPYNAAKNPTYEDKEMKFDLVKHVDAIGMTGWDWNNKCSHWVAFDFDAITGHSDRHAKKLTDEELNLVRESVKNIPWVEVRRSAGGKGLHLYVHLDPVVSTENHNEHAAVARAVLSKLSALVAYDFSAKVDICGGNMWIWHRKAKGTNGFELIKGANAALDEIPINWRDHLKVISGASKRTMPGFIEKVGETSFDMLSGQHVHVGLDDSHKSLIEWLKKKGDAVWWWDTDRHMLVTHTVYLTEAHKELSMRGVFKTLSQGANRGNDHNCFCFPLRNGSWVVRRFSPGCAEELTWGQDKAGWTRCFLNKEPDLAMAARANTGIELPNNGGYQFREAEMAIQTAKHLGVQINLPLFITSRETILKEQKDGRLIVEIKHDPLDPPDKMVGWAQKGNKWLHVFDAPGRYQQDIETPVCDDTIRHTVTEIDRSNSGWWISSESRWHKEPLEHIRPLLKTHGHHQSLIEPIIGLCVQRPWLEVNKPFSSLYPGDRQWNRKGAQLRFLPKKDEELSYPHWKKILDHCGQSLDVVIKNNEWCKSNAILTGADYLKCWIASLLQKPFEPLPYLFFFGPQDCGKSIFHESISRLFHPGSVKADFALLSQSGFNGELQNAVFCYIEETDLSKARSAYARIKDWVTAKTISIHEKGKTPYHLPNTTHWVQCANDHTFCPSFTGDTRITVIRVDALDPLELIPKTRLEEALEREAPDFLGAVMTLELPEPISRLSIPVLSTLEKISIEIDNENQLIKFIKEHMKHTPGNLVNYSEFLDKFHKALPGELVREWGRSVTARAIPMKFPGTVKAMCKGTHLNNKTFIANVSWLSDEKPRIGNLYVMNERGYLVEETSCLQ